MVAAREGSLGIVKKLIKHGADVNLTNKVTGLACTGGTGQGESCDHCLGSWRGRVSHGISVWGGVSHVIIVW